jgi:hypothetical protein
VIPIYDILSLPGFKESYRYYQVIILCYIPVTRKRSDKHSSAPVFTGNTFQDLPRLCETADNIERYIHSDIRVIYINTVKIN